MIHRELRGVLVENLREVREADGRLPNAVVEAYASVLGCTTRHVRRLVTGSSRRDAVGAYSIDTEAFEAYVLNGGDATRTYNHLNARGRPLPGLRTFQRAIRRDLSAGERAFARTGEKGQRRHSVYVTWDAPHRNALWIGDGKELDVLVVPERGLTPIRVWLYSFLDAYSRACMGFVVTPNPDAPDVVAALRASVTLEHPSLGPFHGLPDEMLLDNALQHSASDVLGNAMALGIAHTPIPPYSPYLIGKIERFHRTLRDEWAANCPFYTHAPVAANRKPYWPDGEPMSLRALVESLFTFIQFYNRERPHRALGGRTPEQAWLDDPTPIREPDPAAVRLLQLPSALCTIRKKGIEFRSGIYVAGELNALHGGEVDVRYSPHSPDWIEVFHDARWLCTAARTERTSRVKNALVAQQRERDNRRADRAMSKRVARDQLELERLRNAEQVPAAEGLVAEPDSRQPKPRAKRPRASLEAMLDAFGLADELHQAMTDAKNGGDPDDRDA